MFFETDLLIIGAGPVGLFAAFQSGILNINCIVIDSLNIIGGQCAMLYPEKPIYDIPAYSSITGLELINKLHEQIKPFNTQIMLNQKAIGMQYINKVYHIQTENSMFRAKAVVIATGGGNFIPNKLPLHNIESFEDKSVLYYIQNVSLFKDKVVMIAGGGDSAIDWCINLSKIVKKLYLIHRRNKFNALQSSINTLYELESLNKVKLLTPYQLMNISGNDGMLQSVIVRNIDNNTTLSIDIDYLLPFFGLANSNNVTSWGMNLNQYQKILVNYSTMESSLPGIFAVGDIATYDGKLKLILTGFAEAALAMHNVYSIIHNQELHFEHSTFKKLNI